MILIVDDDRRLRDLLTRFLQEQGFKVVTSETTEDARIKLKTHTIAVMVVDVMMPCEDGFTFVQSLDQRPPVLFLTAKDTLDDKIKGFESGGDDYLTKPFEPLELAYRLKVLMKRSSHEIHIGPYLYTSYDLIHETTKEPLNLSNLDMNLIKKLVQNRGHPVSRYDLAACNRVDERTIDAQINRLRKKLGPESTHCIKTIRHIGYALSEESES